MKRIAALFTAFLMMLCLCSCRKDTSSENDKKEDSKGFFSSILPSDKKNKEDKTTTTTMTPEKASHVAEKIEDGHFESFSEYNEEEKEKIKEYVEKDGYTLEYNKDGSGTLSNEEGSWYIGKGWVENEYTKNVPPIDFGTITMSSEMEEKDEKYYIFLIRDSSPMDASDYVAALKKAGFKEIGHSESNVEAGIVTFTGENNNGQHIELAYSSYGFTVKIMLNK